MKKYNIFQGRNGITEVIYEVLGYEKTERLDNTITRDIYFETYFYLCNRFGNPIIVDDYKKIMIWKFEVKKYHIQIQLNSSWVTFIIFGQGSNKRILSKNNFRDYSMRSPYWVRYWREQERNKRKLINLYSEKKSKREQKIISKLWDVFFDKNGLESDEWTDERFKSERQENGKTKLDEWFKVLEKYNTDIINTENFKHYESRGYSNSKTKHALRTLRQFLNNMLTPIYVRDCPFNIKGRITDKESLNYSRFVDNIKIQYVIPKKSRKNAN